MSRIRRGLIAAVVAACLVPSSGESQSDRPHWDVLAPGLWYRRWTLPTSGTEIPPEAHVFRVDPRTARITVLDARRSGRRVATAATLREERGAWLVMNGGFFDPENKPLGLVIGEAGETSPLRNLDQGVFVVDAGVPRVQHASEPVPARPEVALQAWPRLVVDGRPLQLKPQRSRRSVICVPGDGSVLLLVLETPTSLQAIATEIAKPPTEGGLGCWSALNLDGGPSTQLSLKTPTVSLEIEGGWGVPNGLAVLPP